MREKKPKGERILSWVYVLSTLLTVGLAVNQIFDLQFFSGTILFGPSFEFLFVGFLVPLIFLYRPLRPHSPLMAVDILLAAVFFLCCAYFAWNGYDIVAKGYSYSAPLHMVVMSVVLWALLIEAVRRSAGFTLMVVVLAFSVYPLFAAHMPGLLEGVERPLSKTALFHMLSSESAMGALTSIFGNTVLGFIIFGVAVVAVGGSDFMLNLSHCVVGRTRGGAAKMSVIASGLFGSVSGSPIANVLTTGSVTIPAMKKSGYSAVFAGAVETCASTAGTFTPPIMGATAFVLASFINLPYATVALSASIPAFLYYLGLFVQVDGHAARSGITGPTQEEVPPLAEVLKDGWFFLPTGILLIYLLFVVRWTGESPYIATAAMLVLAQFRKSTRFTGVQFWKFLESVATSAAILLTIMAGAGMLMGAFSLTGIAATFSRELLLLAGGSVPLMLLFTALASMIMGMGMTAIACYIFLALVAAPALVGTGLNELAVHLFLLYCGMLSYITPPVALCAFTAANLADASPMQIAVTASRLGGAIYILPFFFVLNPALLLVGTTGQVLGAVLSATAGVWLLASGLDGYLIGVGNLRRVKGGLLLRGAIAASGFCLAMPEPRTDVLGMVAAVVAVGWAWFAVHRGSEAAHGQQLERATTETDV